MIVRLPYTYGNDAYWRLDTGQHELLDGRIDDLGSIELVKQTSRFVWLEVDAAGLENLKGDAAYYADRTGFEADLYPLCRSAARALAILRRAIEQLNKT